MSGFCAPSPWQSSQNAQGLRDILEANTPRLAFNADGLPTHFGSSTLFRVRHRFEQFGHLYTGPIARVFGATPLWLTPLLGAPVETEAPASSRAHQATERAARMAPREVGVDISF